MKQIFIEFNLLLIPTFVPLGFVTAIFEYRNSNKVINQVTKQFYITRFPYWLITHQCVWPLISSIDWVSRQSYSCREIFHSCLYLRLFHVTVDADQRIMSLKITSCHLSVNKFGETVSQRENFSFHYMLVCLFRHKRSDVRVQYVGFHWGKWQSCSEIH